MWVVYDNLIYVSVNKLKFSIYDKFGVKYKWITQDLSFICGSTFLYDPCLFVWFFLLCCNYGNKFELFSTNNSFLMYQLTNTAALTFVPNFLDRALTFNDGWYFLFFWFIGKDSSQNLCVLYTHVFYYWFFCFIFFELIFCPFFGCIFSEKLEHMHLRSPAIVINSFVLCIYHCCLNRISILFIYVYAWLCCSLLLLQLLLFYFS